MKARIGRSYRVKEFAALTGVSVRALHHYDRLGLLTPRRTQAGYRAYIDADIPIREQIVSLKFIGVPLGDVKRLLRAGAADLSRVLAAQRTVLEEKRRRLDLAITALREAQQTIDRAGVSGLTHIIEVIKMQEQRNEWKKQYEMLVQGKIDRVKAMSPDTRAQLRNRFATLCKEVEGALGEDPAGPRAQELAGRWLELLQAFAPQGAIDPQLLKYAAADLSEGEWPASAPQPEPPFGKLVWEFMAKALAARP